MCVSYDVVYLLYLVILGPRLPAVRRHGLRPGPSPPTRLAAGVHDNAWGRRASCLSIIMALLYYRHTTCVSCSVFINIYADRIDIVAPRLIRHTMFRTFGLCELYVIMHFLVASGYWNSWDMYNLILTTPYP